MFELSELEKLVSVLIIQEDAESIYSLLQTERDNIFSMEIIPYYVLFVQSCQEYMGEKLLKETLDNNFKDIRNHIKAYSKGFEKSKKRILSVDNSHNEDFKNQISLEFLKTKNIHFNLGSYWTDEGHIIGNTQQLSDFLTVKSMFDYSLNDKFYQIGYQIGSFVSSVREGLSESMDYPIVHRTQKFLKINNYYDINTNLKNKLFLQNISKEINLFFLHLLCNMNFIKYILRPLFLDGNNWIFRVEYITSYYTLRSLERFKNYIESNKNEHFETKGLVEIFNTGEKIFKTQLRNCMMHYNLWESGVITFKNIDKPFYGIIENCFDGITYQDYLFTLHNLSDKIIDYLENQFDFSNVKLEKF
ncbi:hypothetical protein [Parvimonas micra]